MTWSLTQICADCGEEVTWRATSRWKIEEYLEQARKSVVQITPSHEATLCPTCKDEFYDRENFEEKEDDLMARSISNNGIGALYGTFDINKTGDDCDLTTSDVGKAVALSGDNEVDFGSDYGLLLGRLEHVQDGISTVQVGGVVRLPYVYPHPCVGDAVVVDGSGSAKQAGAGEPGRGITLAVNSIAGTCDVLL